MKKILTKLQEETLQSFFAHMLLGVKNLKNFPKMLVPFDKDKMKNYFISLANNMLLEAKPG